MRLYTISGTTGFADVYGSGTYGEGTYGCNSSTTTCTAASSSGNPLTNTGVAVGVVVGVACLLLVVVILVRFWRRPARMAEQPVPVDSETEDDSENQRPTN